MKTRIAMQTVALAAGLTGIVAIAGCSDNFARRDTLSPHAGQAQRTNLIIHSTEPAFHPAGERDLQFDGQRSNEAVARYREAAAGTDEPSAEVNGFSESGIQ